MMTRLKSLAQHEAERAANKFDDTPGYATGIACPECAAADCESELFRFVGGNAMIEHHKGRYPVFCRTCCHETTIAPGGGRPPPEKPPVRLPPLKERPMPPLPWWVLPLAFGMPAAIAVVVVASRLLG